MEIYEVNANAISTRSYNLRVLNLMEMGRCGPRKFNRLRNGSGDDTDALIERQLLYRRLPDQNLLNLSVLKLDGSLFDVNVGRKATVAELKGAIEELFSALPLEIEGFSWSHVWGHFCLVYEGQKLVNNKACIKNLGIKDGDQLEFVRYMSASQERRLKQQSSSFKCLSPGTNYDIERQLNHVNNHNDEGEKRHHCEEEEEEAASLPEFKVAHFLKRWLSHTRSRGAARRRLEGRSHVSRFNLHR